ncbi:MAG: hypothetical protein P8Y53_19340, partial [Pseudolabrys sp.]
MGEGRPTVTGNNRQEYNRKSGQALAASAQVRLVFYRCVSSESHDPQPGIAIRIDYCSAVVLFWRSAEAAITDQCVNIQLYGGCVASSIHLEEGANLLGILLQ